MLVYGRPVRAEDLGSHVEIRFFVDDVDDKGISDLQSSWKKIDRNWRAASTSRGIQVFLLSRSYEVLLMCYIVMPRAVNPCATSPYLVVASLKSASSQRAVVPDGSPYVGFDRRNPAVVTIKSQL
jgi:hypothetical protein